MSQRDQVLKLEHNPDVGHLPDDDIPIPYFLNKVIALFPMLEIALTPDGCLQAGTGASWKHFHHVADVGTRIVLADPGH